MDLREFVRLHGGLIVLYRVKNDPGTRGLKAQVSDESVRREVINAVYDGKIPSGLTVLASDVSPYVEGKRTNKIASIVVISSDPQAAEEQLETEKKRSKELKKRKLSFLKNELAPWLKILERSGLVKAIILRGDLVDPSRWPSEESDIDLITLTSFSQEDTVKKRRLFNLLETVPAGLSVVEYSFFPGGYKGVGRQIKPTSSGRELVEVSLISLEDMKKVLEKSPPSFPEYYSRNLRLARVLWQKNGEGEHFLKPFA